MIEPFAGITVLDLSRLLAGPYCSQMLADLGAKVIKVEPIAGDDSRHLGPPFVDGMGVFFLAANGGKRSIAIDVTRPEGRSAVLQLARTADVVIENFRPGMAAKLGLAYADIRSVNDTVIYCSISGFGASGPMSRRGGVDTVFQATGGLVAAIDSGADTPLKVGSPVADISAAHSAAFAITAALVNRMKHGAGAQIEVSIRDALITLLTPLMTYAAVTGEEPPVQRNASPFAAPADIFRTSDGHIAVSVINDKLWQSLCAALGLSAHAADPRFAEPNARLRNRAALTELVQAALMRQPTAYWEDRLARAGVPVGRIMRPLEITQDAQLAENGLFIDTPVGRGIGLPFRIDSEGLTERGTMPACGEHTIEILRECGFSEEDIRHLLQTRIADADRALGPERRGSPAAVTVTTLDQVGGTAP